MPAVLSTAPGLRRSGHVYNDETGVSYEFPLRYRRIIEPGVRFIYFVPKIGYTGAGVVGRISASSAPDRLIARIENYVEFPDVVALKDDGGRYFEASPYAPRENVFFAQGVRPITEATMAAVLGAAAPVTSVTKPDPRTARRSYYAAGEVALAVEAYSVATVVAMLEHQHAIVQPMPHNNPGFDIRVGATEDADLYVEVKGTQSSAAEFFISEGEREFSEINADRYLLAVVTGIDLRQNSHVAVHWRPGAVESNAVLVPAQWRGRLTN